MSLLEPVQLADMTLQTPMMLAPMAGVTNPPFRRMCREAAARGYEIAGGDLDAHPATEVFAPLGLYVCEMITSRALVQGTSKTTRLIEPDPDEFPKSVQLYGVAPHVMEKAAYIATSRGYADHIDMNFGCPVPKVTRKGGGSALPWKTQLFHDIVAGVVSGTKRGFDAYREAHPEHRATRLPVTVKIRLGIDDDHETFMDAGRAAEDAGADAVIVHGRTLEEHYSGSAHWEPIGELVKALDVPVFGNGDIFMAEDMVSMAKTTGCAGVVVGRGAQGRPWIFTDLIAANMGVEHHSTPSLGQVCQMIMRHAQLSVDHLGDEHHAMRDMRKHISWYLRGFPVGGGLRQRLATVASMDQLRQALEELDWQAPYPDICDDPRGRKGRPRTPRLPYGWLDSRDIDDAARELLKGAEIDGLG